MGNKKDRAPKLSAKSTEQEWARHFVWCQSYFSSDSSRHALKIISAANTAIDIFMGIPKGGADIQKKQLERMCNYCEMLTVIYQKNHSGEQAARCLRQKAIFEAQLRALTVPGASSGNTTDAAVQAGERGASSLLTAPVKLLSVEEYESRFRGYDELLEQCWPIFSRIFSGEPESQEAAQALGEFDILAEKLGASLVAVSKSMQAHQQMAALVGEKLQLFVRYQARYVILNYAQCAINEKGEDISVNLDSLLRECNTFELQKTLNAALFTLLADAQKLFKCGHVNAAKIIADTVSNSRFAEHEFECKSPWCENIKWLCLAEAELIVIQVVQVQARQDADLLAEVARHAEVAHSFLEKWQEEVASADERTRHEAVEKALREAVEKDNVRLVAEINTLDVERPVVLSLDECAEKLQTHNKLLEAYFVAIKDEDQNSAVKLVGDMYELMMLIEYTLFSSVNRSTLEAEKVLLLKIDYVRRQILTKAQLLVQGVSLDDRPKSLLTAWLDRQAEIPEPVEFILLKILGDLITDIRQFVSINKPVGAQSIAKELLGALHDYNASTPEHAEILRCYLSEVKKILESISGCEVGVEKITEEKIEEAKPEKTTEERAEEAFNELLYHISRGKVENFTQYVQGALDLLGKLEEEQSELAAEFSVNCFEGGGWTEFFGQLIHEIKAAKLSDAVKQSLSGFSKFMPNEKQKKSLSAVCRGRKSEGEKAKRIAGNPSSGRSAGKKTSAPSSPSKNSSGKRMPESKLQQPVAPSAQELQEVRTKVDSLALSWGLLKFKGPNDVYVLSDEASLNGLSLKGWAADYVAILYKALKVIPDVQQHGKAVSLPATKAVIAAFSRLDKNSLLQEFGRKTKKAEQAKQAEQIKIKNRAAVVKYAECLGLKPDEGGGPDTYFLPAHAKSIGAYPQNALRVLHDILGPAAAYNGSRRRSRKIKLPATTEMVKALSEIKVDVFFQQIEKQEAKKKEKQHTAQPSAVSPPRQKNSPGGDASAPAASPTLITSVNAESADSIDSTAMMRARLSAAAFVPKPKAPKSDAVLPQVDPKVALQEAVAAVKANWLDEAAAQAEGFSAWTEFSC